MSTRWRFAWTWTIGAVLAGLLLPAASCPLKDSDGDGVPDVIDQCPDVPGPPENIGCPITPPEAYDCANPPALAGLVPVSNPIEGRYIVVRKRAAPRLSVASATGFAARFNAQEVKYLNATTLSLKVAKDKLSALVADPEVQYVQQEGRKSTRISWGLDRLDAREGLDGKYTPLLSGIAIHAYVNDTGVSPHPDFEGRLSSDCFSTIVLKGCEDGHGHGTHVAGTIAGKTWGVAKKAVLHSVRFLDPNGSGTDSDAIRSLDWIAAHQLPPGERGVVNASWGGSPAPAVDAAVCRVIESGKVFVAAAGNESSDSRTSTPARIIQVVTVGAMDRNDRGASFTNYGPGVDLFAPGVDIESTAPGGGTATHSGTSMASPHVAGGAALYLEAHRGATVAEVEQGLIGESTPDTLSGIGEGSPNRLLYVQPVGGGGAATGPKVVDGRFVPFLRGAVNCCDYSGTPDVDEGYADGWPLITAAALDRIKGPGTVNWTHVRTGPFSTAHGGTEPLARTLAKAIAKYGPGPAILPDLRVSLEEAKARGIFVEVDLVDCWSLATADMNYYGDTCAVTRSAPPARYIEWVQAVVDVSWDMPVTYNLGNECPRCRPVPEWDKGLYDAAKAALAAKGVDRPVGSTVSFSDTRTTLDYRTYHGFQPVPEGWPLDVPTMLTESDNRAHTAAEWSALTKETEGRGGYLAVWRGPDSWDTHNAQIAAMPKLEEPWPPTPPPTTECQAGVCPNVYINAKHGAGKYGDSTMRCRDRTYCEKATGIPGTTDCALGVEGTEQRIVCELAHAPGCHRWQYQAEDGSWNRCLPAPGWASCDHFDRWSEGTPYTGPCDVDPSGAPIAGWQTIPRGNTYFRACGAGPTAGICSNPVKFDQ